MTTLLIYELSESTQLYLIANAPAWLHDCHGQYLGFMDSDQILMTRLSDYLENLIPISIQQGAPISVIDRINTIVHTGCPL